MVRFPASRLLATLAAGLAVGSLLVAPVAAAPRAKAPSYVGAANGILGVSQTIQVTAPRFAGKTVSLTATPPAGAASTLSVTLNGQGQGSVSWTPSTTGYWTVQGAGPFAVATGSRLFVSAVPTSTTLFAAALAQTQTATTVVATVTSTSGTYVPAGSVTFGNQLGGTYGSAPLVPGAGNSASATFSWTPPSPGNFPLQATYNPTLGSGGFANAGSSSSVDTVEVVLSQPLVSLRLAGVYRLGQASSVSTVVNNSTLTGSAAIDLNVNGTATSISGSTPVSNSVATVPWTPTALGNQVITTSFSATNSNASGSAQQVIAVLPALTRDPISAGPSGQGPWPAGGTVTMAPNARVAVAATSQSGSPLSIGTSGGCVVIASTLIAPATPGTCTVTVTSPGSSGFAANTATYTVNVVKG